MPWVLAYTVAVLGVCSLLVSFPAGLQSPPLQTLAAVDGSRPGERWVIVRSPSGSWYLNGEAYSSSGLARRLVEAEARPLSLVLIPAHGRRVAQISEDLRWLRKHTGLPLTLGVIPPALGS